MPEICYVPRRFSDNLNDDIEDQMWQLGQGMQIDGAPFELKRIALNIDQVRQYGPPPNPAKMSDSRAEDHVRLYGRESWELDALPPDVLDMLISDELGLLIDFDAFEQSQANEEEYRTRINRLITEHGNILELSNG